MEGSIAEFRGDFAAMIVMASSMVTATRCCHTNAATTHTNSRFGGNAAFHKIFGNCFGVCLSKAISVHTVTDAPHKKDDEGAHNDTPHLAASTNAAEKVLEGTKLACLVKERLKNSYSDMYITQSFF